MYDTLGKYGVLNAAATANANTNVDVAGDFPTNCSSDYLIAVTNMNQTGVKVNSAGYTQQPLTLAHSEKEPIPLQGLKPMVDLEALPVLLLI